MRPKLHFTAQQNWINDPNGLIYYNGEYHVFYQHYPYACYWGTMHWGHATTKDFVNFKHHPIALYPSKDYDRNGCFSGTAIEKDGKLYLYYTSIKYAKENPEYVHIQYSDDDLRASQSLVISEDGYRFDNKNNKYKLIDVIEDNTLGDYRHTRDPKVWKSENGKYLMAVGSKVKSETGYCGQVLFYESDDAIHFTYKNRYGDDTIGNMWECPDVFKLNNQWFMIYSPENIDEAPKPVSNAVFMPIDFDEETCTIHSHKDYTYLDYGLDFYAPQTFMSKDNERMMLGWLRMRTPIDGENWVGMYIMPRLLEERDGHIYQTVIPEIKELFKEQTNHISLDEPFLLKATLNKDSYLNFGGFKISVEDDKIVLDRKDVSVEHDKVCNLTYSEPLNNNYNVEIYYDYHVFEIFINDGKYVMSQVVYDLNDNVEINNVDYKVYKCEK